MGAAETIKATLSMADVARKYGFEPNRGGYIRCPFHDERTPSLKLYDAPGKGFSCYGCHASGSVIDFVMLLFRLSYPAAVLRIGTDFGILVGGRPDWREVQETNKIIAERRRKAREYERIHAEWIKAIDIIHAQAPQFPDDPWPDEWCEAMMNVDYLEYQMNELEVAGEYGR